MGALTFQPNGDRIDALQVDGERVGYIKPSVLGGGVFVAYSPGEQLAQHIGLCVGDLATCRAAIVTAWAKRFPHA